MIDKIKYDKLESSPRCHEKVFHQEGGMICKYIAEKEQLQSRLKEAESVIDFYGTFTPHQFPEGYYEICIEEGIGGYNRFGTIAREYKQKYKDKE